MQTKSLLSGVDATRIQGTLGVLESTVPERSALTDYAYGDPFEVLAYAHAGVSVLTNFCWNCKTYACYARVDNEVCTVPPFEPTSASIRMLGLYGISGYVGYTYIDPETGRTDYRSLLSDEAESGRIEYCNPFRQDENDDFLANSYYVQTLLALNNAKVSCDSAEAIQSASSNRRALQRHNLQRDGGVFQYQSRPPSLRHRTVLNSVIGRAPRRNLIESFPRPQASLGIHERVVRDTTTSNTGTRRSDLSSMPNLNPLLLKLDTVGLDDGRVWIQYSKDTSEWDAGYRWVNNSDWEGSQESLDKYRYAGAVYVGVDVSTVEGAEIRYSLDDSTPDCQNPVQESQYTCIRNQNPDPFWQLSRAFQYNGKTRIVIYAVSTANRQTYGWSSKVPEAVNECSNLKVWICPTPLSTPTNISALNLTEALLTTQMVTKTQDSDNLGIGPMIPLRPLEPGPMVNMNFLVNQALSSGELESLRLELCEKIWDNQVLTEDDKCQWQIWVDLESGSNIEMWRDDGWFWVRNENEFFVLVWTVSVTVLMKSNSEAAQARNRLTQKVNKDDFIRLYHVQSTNATASGDIGALTNNFQYFAHVASDQAR